MTINNALVLVGGTGGLGMQLAKGLAAAAGYGSHKAIVRDAAKASALQDAGWTIVELADFFDATGLEHAMAGAKTVVSTLSGGDLVKLETATINAAKKVGATLFIPSQFGVDYRHWEMSNPFIASKGETVKVAKAAGIPTLFVFSGCFTETTMPFLFDIVNNKATLVGDPNNLAKISFTHRSDIGKVLAKALTDDTVLPSGDNNVSFLSIAGETMSYKEFVETYERVTGKTMEIEYIDPATAKIKEEELLAKGLEGDMNAFMRSFKLHLIGVPERGFTGLDTSDAAKSYGMKLITVEETFQSLYG